jgi:ankyrin repeat protein
MEKIRELVEMGCDVHEQAVGGDTPLHVAAGIGHAETSGFLSANYQQLT